MTSLLAKLGFAEGVARWVYPAVDRRPVPAPAPHQRV